MATTPLTVLPWQQALWQRLADQYSQGRLAHAQLYCGSVGIGKKVFAEAMATLLLCQNTAGAESRLTSACGQCRSCELLTHGYHPDLMRVALEDGSRVIKIEQVRAVTEFINKTSHGDGAKVVVLHDVEQLNASSANALLKTLEEPSANCFLILLSHNPGRLMATIRSRCQKVEFTVPNLTQSRDWLTQQGLNAEESNALLSLANGRPLLAYALSTTDLLSQRIKILQAVTSVLEKKQSPQALMQLAKTIEIRTIISTLSDLCAELVKTTLVSRGIDPTHSENLVPLDLVVPPELQERLRLYQAQTLTSAIGHDGGISSTRSLYKLYTKCQISLKQLASVTNPNPQLILEGLVWQLARL